MEPVHVPRTQFDVIFENEDVVFSIGGEPRLQGSWKACVNGVYLMSDYESI
jgi:hypothetical protein